MTRYHDGNRVCVNGESAVQSPKLSLLALGACLLGLPAADAQTATGLKTLAETTHYQRTGRYEEVERLCKAFAQAWPAKVKCIEFGRTPEQRPMLALVASADGTLTAEAARGKSRPVVVMQGGIHAGEIDGKDAGFLVLREMLEGRSAKNALERVTFVFVPVFNIDGHERFGRWNRPNQRGPEEMGWRTTAQNYNLNRDYTKADAPEMQAMLRLLTEWDPILYADLHVTDGAKFQHDIAILVEPTLAGDADLMKAGQRLSDAVLKQLAAQGSLPIDFYPEFVKDDDPSTGAHVYVSTPRFSQAYRALHNRFGVLVETHSWKDYPTRVRITHNAIIAMIEQAASQGASWLSLAQQADTRTAALAGTPVDLSFDNTAHTRTIEFKGYAYTREPSAISGGLVVRYDTSKPQIWKIPLRDEVKATLTVTAPRGGYIIPASQAQWLGEKLRLHGIRFSTFDRGVSQRPSEVFRASKVAWSSESIEGHMTAKLEGEWSAEARDITAGALFVPIEQANARLVMALLEPQAPDSYASWGFFNTAFERKEYMEPYVTEEVAKKMLEDDPKLRAEFIRKLDDPAFAKDPEARLDFFYRRHPSWDERLNLYPIYRTDRAP